MEDLTAITCQSIGVAGTTKIHFLRAATHVVARVGISIFGQTNQAHGPDANPFDVSFRDNYAEGVGQNREAALEDLRRDLKQISDSLWAE